MSAWNVARRHRRRPGFHLVDYGEVALPVYSLSLRVITLAHKKVPPIEEFVLRAVAAGMDSQDEVGALLGLQPNVVRGALVGLAQSEALALVGVGGSRAQTLLMTQRGRAVLEESELVVPEEQNITVHFDGLLRTVQLLGWTELLQPREMRERGLLEIPSFPARKPIVSDLRLPEVEQVIRSTGGIADLRRDLLAIRGIERATRLFREAVALVYVADHSSDVQVAFALDGKLSEVHERAFAIAGGVKKLSFCFGDLAGNELSKWDELGGTILDGLGTEDRLESLQEELARADAVVQDCVRDLEKCESVAERIAASTRLDEARAILTEKQRELDYFRIRELACYDCGPLLENALSAAKQRLVIVSQGISGKIVNRDFIKQIQDLLTRRVTISIAVGRALTQRPKGDEAALENLEDLARSNARLRLTRDADVTRSILGVDDAFVAIATFDWLGHAGNHQFCRRHGVIVRDAEKVRHILNRYGQGLDE